MTFALALAALVGLPATESSLATILARGRLIVSVKNDASREHKDPAHANKRGFEIELAHVLARKVLGDPARLELKMLPRPVRLPMLAAGAVDLVVSMIPVTANNARQCDLSHPYYTSDLALLYPRRSGRLELRALAGKRVAFRKQSYNDYGAELARLADEAHVAVEVRYFTNIERAVAAVAAGEAVAVGGNYTDLEAYARAHPEYQVSLEVLEGRTVAVAVRKGDRELLALVNAAIDELARSGELARMTERWHLPACRGCKMEP